MAFLAYASCCILRVAFEREISGQDLKVPRIVIQARQVGAAREDRQPKPVRGKTGASAMFALGPAAANLPAAALDFLLRRKICRPFTARRVIRQRHRVRFRRLLQLQHSGIPLDAWFN